MGKYQWILPDLLPILFTPPAIKSSWLRVEAFFISPYELVSLSVEIKGFRSWFDSNKLPNGAGKQPLASKKKKKKNSVRQLKGRVHQENLVLHAS
eukprot:scaffold120882_cov16-Tisochrysis_lutea.AAC.3